VAVPSERLPLPFSPRFWSDVVFERPVASRALFGEVLREPRAFLLWVGGLSLDPGTRQYFEAHDELIRAIRNDAAGVFAAFSGALSIRQGRVTLADEPEMRAMWEDITGEQVTDPARFLRRLLTKDEGRLAVFFDLIQRLPPNNRRFAQGLWISDAEERRAQFRSLYEAVSGTDPSWKPFLSPYQRFSNDPWLLLRSLRFAPAGDGSRLVGPQQKRFWERAFDGGIPDDPARLLAGLEEDGPVSAAWLVGKVCRDPVEMATRHRRFVQVLATQRIAAGWTAASLPQLLTVSRGSVAFPALVLELDRSGLIEPASSARAVQRAQELSEIGDADHRLLGIAGFQGALVLVHRLVRAGSLDTAGGSALLADLVDVPLRDGRYGDGLANWLVQGVLPRLGSRPATDRDLVDEMAIRAGSQDVVEWEGDRYVVDWNQAERVRLAGVRRQQAGVRLEDIVNLVAAIKTASAPPYSRERAQEIAAKLAGLDKDLSALVPLQEMQDSPHPGQRVRDAAKELGKVRAPDDHKRFDRAREALVAAAEWAVPHLLVALAYTPHVGDPASAAARASDLAMRHHFGTADITTERARDAFPWAPPSQAGAGGIVGGSLLGLDVALARLSLRRLSSTKAPRPPTLSAANLDALAMQVTLGNPRLDTPGVLASIATSLARGREALRAAQVNPGALDELASRVNMDAGRRGVLAWMLEHEPERVPEMVSLGELVALGHAGDLQADAMGTSTLPADGAWTLAWPHAEAWQPYSGRPQLGLLAARVPDLSIRIAELMEDHGLPAEIFVGVLSYAVQDLIDQLTVASSDDWMGLVRHAQRLTPEQFEDYVAALVGLGIIAPAGQERH
jgi:hypothetical protein